MATLKQRLHRKNASGTYDTIQLETNSSIVMRPSGRSVEQDLTDFLPKSQASDTVPNSLSKGQMVAGNTKAWLMTNSRKEISFSDHTHSNYALTNHTHSNYALTTHTHSGYAKTNHTHSQYVTEVDINSMIEDVIDSYVPTIKNMGQIGSLNITADQSSTLTVPSSANIILFYYKGSPSDYGTLMSTRTSTGWSAVRIRVSSYNYFTISGSGNILTIESPDSVTLRYVYF